MKFAWALAAIALTNVAGCKSKTSNPAPPSSGSAATVPNGSAGNAVVVAPPATEDWLAAVMPKDAPAGFAAWDMPARAKAWQGVWLSQPGVGYFVALEVTGKIIKSWDGKVEKSLELGLESPCSAKLIEKSAGGESSTTTHFTLKDGKLLAGLGDAGSRKGQAAIVCASNVILTLDEAGECTQWTPSFGNYAQGKATCAIAAKGDKEVFTATINGQPLELIIDGDAIYSEQLGKNPDKGFADFAAAKAARR
ncbi:MAG TPA: hypothetical protein PLF40_31740 [Kofleriaceae bacterium]|nr:hypothetical protein [Kofleriaceae bacterium]